MIPQKARYAVKALQYLADHYECGTVHLSEIVKDQKIPTKFLTVILAEMRRHDIVTAQRGPNGGYRLARPPSEIRYSEAIRSSGASLSLMPCANREAYKACEHCVPETCRFRSLMLCVYDQTLKMLDALTLADSIPLLPAQTS